MISVNADAIPDWLDYFLLAMGFHGIAGDGCECIYVPILQSIVFIVGNVAIFAIAWYVLWNVGRTDN